MTARYAHIKDRTLRREWERYQQRVNIQGETIQLDPNGPHSDAAWALENLARAKQTLPNGYCGLPLQQTLPAPQRVFDLRQLPHHRRVPAASIATSSHRTEQLIAAARENGRAAGRDERAGPAEPAGDHRGPPDPRRGRRCAMPAEPLRGAASRRSSDAIARGRAALAELARRGEQVTFQAVARAPGVSRQWLYTHAELRAEIERLARHARADRPAVPAAPALQRGVAAPARREPARREPPAAR